jgi:hypothetical protein
MYYPTATAATVTSAILSFFECQLIVVFLSSASDRRQPMHLLNLRGVDGKKHDRQLNPTLMNQSSSGACEDFAVMAGSTATCAGSLDCISSAGTSVSIRYLVTGNLLAILL